MQQARQWFQSSLIQAGFPANTAVTLARMHQQLPAARAELVVGPARAGKSRYLLGKALAVAKAASSDERVMYLAASDNASRRARAFIDMYSPLGRHNHEVHTPASLAAAVLREQGASGKVHGYAAQAMLMHHVLEYTPTRHVKSSTFTTHKLLAYFRTLQNLGITPAQYSQFADTCQDAAIRDAELEKARIYERFMAAKKERGIYSVDDVIDEARLVLGQDKALAAAVSGRFSLCLVDDIQLLSGSMVELIQPLHRIQHTTFALDSSQDTSGFTRWSTMLGAVSPPYLRLFDPFDKLDITQLGGVGSDGHKEHATRTLMGAWGGKCLVYPTAGSSDTHSYDVLKHLDGKTNQVASAPALGNRELQVKFAHFDTQVQELLQLCENIEDRAAKQAAAVASSVQGERGDTEELDSNETLRYGSQAVMAPQWSDLDTVCSALAAKGIPYQCHFKGNQRLFEVPVVRAILSVFHHLTTPTDDRAAYDLMSSCVRYHVPPLILAKIMEVRKNRYLSVMDLLMELADAIVEERTHPLLERIMQTPGIAAAQQAHRSESAPYGLLQGLVNLTQDMQHFSTLASKTGVTDLMTQILIRMNLLDKYKNPESQEADVESAALTKFLATLRQAEEMTASDRLAFVEPALRLMQSYNADGTILDPETRPEEVTDAVHVLPLNLAKDYDHHFRVVHIPFLTDDKFPGKLKESQTIPLELLRISATDVGITSGTSVSSYLSQLASNDAFHNRLLYTAAQRSTGEVIMSFVSHARSIPSSVLVDLMELDAEIPKSRIPPLPLQGGLAGARASSPRTPEDDTLDEVFGPIVTPVEPAADAASSKAQRKPTTKQPSLQKIFEDPVLGQPYKAPSPIQLSYSSLHTYRRCKYAYYLEHVLGIKAPSNAVMMYGTAMHAVTEFCVGELLEGRVPTAEDLHAKLHENWGASSAVFDYATQEQELLQEGREGLTRFLARILSEQDPNYRYPWQEPLGSDDQRAVRVPTLLEHWFDVPLSELDVRLVGLFDRVDRITSSPTERQDDDLQVIVDYKSHMGSKEAVEMAENSLQLKIYALAHSKLFGKLPDFAVIESIEDPKAGWKEVSDKDASIAYAAIRSAANGIRQGDFTPNASAFNCRYCPHKATCVYSAANDSSEGGSRTVFSDV